MTQEQKIIRAKVGLLELAKQLSNIRRACKPHQDQEPTNQRHLRALPSHRLG